MLVLPQKDSFIYISYSYGSDSQQAQLILKFSLTYVILFVCTMFIPVMVSVSLARDAVADIIFGGKEAFLF